MLTIPILLAFIFAAAVLFDISNGANDISGIIAAPVTSGALSPRSARLLVLMGAAAGPFIAPAAVARAYSSGLVHLPVTDSRLALLVLLCGLAGATLWNALARKLGWPTSSSHALVGALIGGALAAMPQQEPIRWGWSQLSHGQLTGFAKVVIALVVSPVIGLAVGWLLYKGDRVLLRRAHVEIARPLHVIQCLLLAVQGLTYGMNDAQKTMGILTAAVMVATRGGLAEFSAHGIPAVLSWVKMVSITGVVLGALMGSAKIFRKLGEGVFNIHLVEGFSAQTGAASVVLAASLLGGPVSSTQVIASGIVGAGAASRRRAVHWSAAYALVTGWILTIPASGLVTAILMLAVRQVVRF